jgi:hypothetical protein
VLQANDGVDFDYLKGRTPVRFEDTAGPSHSESVGPGKKVSDAGLKLTVSE